MTERIRKLEEKISDQEKEIAELKQAVGIHPPSINPYDYCQGHLDRQIIKLMLEECRMAGPRQHALTPTEIARAFKMKNPAGSPRVIIWKHLRRMDKRCSKINKKPLFIETPSGWRINDKDFTLPPFSPEALERIKKIEKKYGALSPLKYR